MLGIKDGGRGKGGGTLWKLGRGTKRGGGIPGFITRKRFKNTEKQIRKK